MFQTDHSGGSGCYKAGNDHLIVQHAITKVEFLFCSGYTVFRNIHSAAFLLLEKKLWVDRLLHQMRLMNLTEIDQMHHHWISEISILSVN